MAPDRSRLLLPDRPPDREHPLIGVEHGHVRIARACPVPEIASSLFPASVRDEIFGVGRKPRLTIVVEVKPTEDERVLGMLTEGNAVVFGERLKTWLERAKHLENVLEQLALSRG